MTNAAELLFDHNIITMCTDHVNIIAPLLFLIYFIIILLCSRRFLRLFSSGGNQNQLIWRKGEPVTMVGRGRLLAVFYHESSPLANKTQQIGYTLLDAKDFRVISRGSVSCISKGSSISWVGFNNDFSLVVMDSDGMLSILVGTGQSDDVGTMLWEWVPVLDTIGLRKSTDDSHWPIAVYDGKLVCIPLKGGNTYPDATRRPVTTTLGLRMPLARSVLSKKYVFDFLVVALSPHDDVSALILTLLRYCCL